MQHTTLDEQEMTIRSIRPLFSTLLQCPCIHV